MESNAPVANAAYEAQMAGEVALKKYARFVIG
jgi:hypothetical protein